MNERQSTDGWTRPPTDAELEVYRAYTHMGPNRAAHIAAQHKLQNTWPTLHAAILGIVSKVKLWWDEEERKAKKDAWDEGMAAAKLQHQGIRSDVRNPYWVPSDDFSVPWPPVGD